jgi:hypothetical protein
MLFEYSVYATEIPDFPSRYIVVECTRIFLIPAAICPNSRFLNIRDESSYFK